MAIEGDTEGGGNVYPLWELQGLVSFSGRKDMLEMGVQIPLPRVRAGQGCPLGPGFGGWCSTGSINIPRVTYVSVCRGSVAHDLDDLGRFPPLVDGGVMRKEAARDYDLF